MWVASWDRDRIGSASAQRPHGAPVTRSSSSFTLRTQDLREAPGDHSARRIPYTTPAVPDQQSQPQSQQSHPSQQSPQPSQLSQQSQQSSQSHRPSLRSRLHGSSYSPQHSRHVQAGPAHTAQPASSPRRSRRGGWGGGNGPPGPPGGAYGPDSEGADPCAQEAVPKARSTEVRSSCTSSRWASPLSTLCFSGETPDPQATSRSASRIPCRASSASRRASASGVPVADGGPPRERSRAWGRVPGARRGVSFPVLHRVQETGEPPEQPPGLGERPGVARPSGQDGGVREGRRGRRLGRFGDGQNRRPGPRERLDAGLPVHGVHEHRRVEPDGGSGTGPHRVPARGHPARGERHRSPRQQPVPVREVVPHLGRGEDQRHGGRESRPLTPCDGRGTHPAQWTRPRCTPPTGGLLGLSLRQNGYEQPVVVGHHSRELPVILAQRETQSTQMRNPLGLEALTEPMPTGLTIPNTPIPPWFV